MLPDYKVYDHNLDGNPSGHRYALWGIQSSGFVEKHVTDQWLVRSLNVTHPAVIAFLADATHSEIAREVNGGSANQTSEALLSEIRKRPLGPQVFRRVSASVAKDTVPQGELAFYRAAIGGF